jgi:hypothetical protein
MSADPPDPSPGPVKHPGLRRELRYFLIVGGFGVVILPFLTYLAGKATLGPYDGGLGSFLATLYRDFVTLSPAALALLFGPYLLFQVLRLLTRPFRHGRRR